MFEKDLPGYNTTGFGGAAVSALPLETCETINESWGFNITDRNYKSISALIHYLVKASGYGANFLLNIGPMPNGQIQPEFTERLQAMGQWLQQNGETIYGTKAGFIKPQSWGAVTEKENKVFIHLLNSNDEKLFIKFPYKIKSVKTFVGKQAVKYQLVSDGYLVIDIKTIPRQDYDTIVEIEVQR
jgi:alpha-L-fucosidase